MLETSISDRELEVADVTLSREVWTEVPITGCLAGHAVLWWLAFSVEKLLHLGTWHGVLE